MKLYYILLGLTMGHMYSASCTELPQFKTLRIILLVFRCGVVAAFAGCASQRHHDAILFAFASHFSTPYLFRAGLATLLLNNSL
jgi:hypothetical protein